MKMQFKNYSKSEKGPVSGSSGSSFGLEMAKEYVEEIPEEVIQKLINPYWPGALTIVLKAKKDKVSESGCGGGETIGVRMPNHPIILEIIKKLEFRFWVRRQIFMEKILLTNLKI